jgi:hypothetical protein
MVGSILNPFVPLMALINVESAKGTLYAGDNGTSQCLRVKRQLVSIVENSRFRQNLFWYEAYCQASMIKKYF